MYNFLYIFTKLYLYLFFMGECVNKRSPQNMDCMVSLGVRLGKKYR